MTKDKAMKLALEALERSMEAGLTGIKVDEAISALKQTLDPKNSAVYQVAVAIREACHKAWVSQMENFRSDIDIKAIIESVVGTELPEQIEQKPVAYRVWNRMGGISYRQTKPDQSEYAEWDALYTAPPSKPMTGWQPIETAPKTGRELILLLTPSLWPQLAYSNTWWLSGFSVETNPTHWMPIPAIETKHGIFGSLPND